MKTPSFDLDAAVEAIRSGGVLIYPTETLYALGCDARNRAAVARVSRLKGRPENKPLPLVVADLDGLRGLAEGELPEAVLRLAQAFWPGPLSILVRTLGDLPAAVRDVRGFSSVRVTAHPLAQALCRGSRTALVATSANMSGEPPAATPAELDPALTVSADLVLDQRPWPSGGRASTVVRFLDGKRLEVIRQGAVSLDSLKAQGFSVAVA